jgi:hypothetical protein
VFPNDDGGFPDISWEQANMTMVNRLIERGHVAEMKIHELGGEGFPILSLDFASSNLKPPGEKRPSRRRFSRQRH